VGFLLESDKERNYTSFSTSPVPFRCATIYSPENAIEKMSQPAVQTLQYALDRTPTSEPSSDPRLTDDNVSEKASKDVENADSDSERVEIDQDDGVTRIEALCQYLEYISSHND